MITISNAAFYLSELLLPIDDPCGVVLNLLISTNRKLPSILWGALNKGRHLPLHQTHQTHQKSEKFWMNVLGSSSNWEFMTLLSTKYRMPTSLICYFILLFYVQLDQEPCLDCFLAKRFSLLLTVGTPPRCVASCSNLFEVSGQSHFFLCKWEVKAKNSHRKEVKSILCSIWLWSSQ